jgi:hypothetical protein
VTPIPRNEPPGTLSTFSTFKENQRVTNSENAQKNQDAQGAQGFGGEHLADPNGELDGLEGEI